MSSIISPIFGQKNIPEEGIPTMTTSIKNVGLDEPKRSGAEYVSLGGVTLSPHKPPIVKELTALLKMLCGGSYIVAERVTARSSAEPRPSLLDGFADAYREAPWRVTLRWNGR